MTSRRPFFYGVFAVIFVVGIAGFLSEGCQQEKPGVFGLLDATYRAAQLFLVELDRSCASNVDFKVDLLLNAARFGALLLFAYAAIAFILPNIIQNCRVSWQCRTPHRRIVVLGYDALGQNVVSGLRAAQRRLGLTVVHRGVTRELTELARRAGIVLVEGDPSNPDVLKRVRAGESKTVVVALGNDMMTIDAAVSVKSIARKGPMTVRAIINDPELSAALPETAPRGFLGANDVSYFSLPVEAARLLWAEARFDRTALEMRQPRVHLVIIGCGAQGEAIATETLLSSWRVGLSSPVLSIFDLEEEAVRQRFARKAPALFPELDREGTLSLPVAARADVHFHQLDLRCADFSQSGAVAKALLGRSEPTAWIFTGPDDTLNLKASSQLYSQMLRKELPSAPIRVRVRAGYQDSPLVLAEHPVTIAKAFGSQEQTLTTSDICMNDPDRMPRELHATYIKQSDLIVSKGQETTRHPSWEELPETLRASNRRLYHQAAMKIEDLGLQWKALRRAVPVVENPLRQAYVEIEEALDYGKIEADQPLSSEWWHTQMNGSSDTRLDYTRANRIKNVAIVEHNRWIMDRALDGWRLTAQPLAELRDDVRRRHHTMHDWTTLQPHIRRYDAVLLRALISGGGEDREATAWERRLATALVVPRPAGVATELRIVGPEDDPERVTELRLNVPPHLDRSAAQKIIADAPLLLAQPRIPTVHDRLCRIRFDFFDPPSASSVAAANAIGRAFLAQEGSIRTPAMEISTLWRWGRSNAPVFAFAGVKDLSRVGGAEGLAQFLSEFFARRLATGRMGGLASGYAPGADRLAVAAWNDLSSARPDLIFPYAQTVAPSRQGAAKIEYLSTRIEEASSDEIMATADCNALGNPRLARRRTGIDAHTNQSLDILELADVLIALYDGEDTGPGSVGHTVREANRLNKKIVVIERTDNGWRSDDPDDLAIDAELEIILPSRLSQPIGDINNMRT